MATSLIPNYFQPITIPQPSSTNRFNQIKPVASSSSSAKWWTPLFNLSPDPDYIHKPVADPDNNKARFAPGCFTEEKAKQLRMKTVETVNFHDIMYHSAIASRLASDVSGR